MSTTKNGGVRCDACGRITKNKRGAYSPVPGAPQDCYILGDVYFGLPDTGRDWCEECFDRGRVRKTKTSRAGA